MESRIDYLRRSYDEAKAALQDGLCSDKHVEIERENLDEAIHGYWTEDTVELAIPHIADLQYRHSGNGGSYHVVSEESK